MHFKSEQSLACGSLHHDLTYEAGLCRFQLRLCRVANGACTVALPTKPLPLFESLAPPALSRYWRCPEALRKLRGHAVLKKLLQLHMLTTDLGVQEILALL